MKPTKNNDTQILHQQLQDHKRLIRVLQTIGSSLEVEEILQHLVAAAIDLCNADQGAIMLFDPRGTAEGKTLIRHEETKAKILDHYFNRLLSAWTRKRRTPLLTDNLIETFGEKQIPAKYLAITAVLSIPLERLGEIIGVINLISLDNKHKFGERELSLLSILASSCAQLIVNARLHESLFVETLRLRKEVYDKYTFHGIIGHSVKMREVFALLERVMPTVGRVLLEGESGTGKELIARIIHYGGSRKDRPFVAVDCGALPANLLESELFGYVRGAFTGAHQDKKGLFEEADSGTLFLDEIVNMPLEVQSKFLRAVQEGEIRPLGSTQVRKVDVRLVAAASGNLRAHVEAGKFREDLFYRLNVVTVSLPPLRERKEDIAILAIHFLGKIAAKYDKKIKGFKPETIAYLESYAWPGNVRELENVVERAVILADQKTGDVHPELLPREIRMPAFEQDTAHSQNSHSSNLKLMKDTYEKRMILEALTKNDWNQSAAAKALEIPESSLRRKMQNYGIRKP